MSALRATLEWRFLAVVIDFAVTFAWTGELWAATGLTVVLLVVKSVIFYGWMKGRDRLVDGSAGSGEDDVGSGIEGVPAGSCGCGGRRRLAGPSSEPGL